MKGMGFRRIGLMVAAAAAAMAGAGAAAQQSVAEGAKQEAKRLMHDPQAGRYQYIGNPGTKRVQRAAQKRRNVIRNRQAHRRSRA